LTYCTYEELPQNILDTDPIHWDIGAGVAGSTYLKYWENVVQPNERSFFFYANGVVAYIIAPDCKRTISHRIAVYEGRDLREMSSFRTIRYFSSVDEAKAYLEQTYRELQEIDF
jgi:hypothetical protein